MANDRVREYLEAGRRLEDAATPGPWETIECCYAIGEYIDVGPVHAWSDEDAAFISDARERMGRYRRTLEELLKVAPQLVADSVAIVWELEPERVRDLERYARQTLEALVSRVLLGEEKDTRP